MNPYIIILGLFLIGSLVTTVWGWRIIARGRKSLTWPNVNGMIEESLPTSEIDDLLPNIVYSYTVSGQQYRRSLEFPSGMTPTPEFTAGYLGRYPVGTSVSVYYDPEHISNATLEPGPAKGDWFIFLLGLGSTLVAIVFLLFGS